jgi:cytochrome P450
MTKNKDDILALLQSPPMAFPVDNPYPAYQQLRERTPVYRISPMQWIITQYEDAVAILKHPDISHWGQDPQTQSMMFSEQGQMSKTLYAYAPDSNTPYRKKVLHALAAKNMKIEVEAMHQQASRVVERLRGRDQIEFMADFAHPFTFDTISRIIGVPKEKVEALSDIVGALLQSGGYSQYITYHPESGDGSAFINFLRALVAEKRARPDNDLCSALIEACTDGEDESFILSLVVFLFYAGHENMMKFLGNAVIALQSHEAVQDTLRKDPRLASSGVDELLRYDSPVQFLLMFAKERVQVGETKIPSGSMLLVCVGAANRDPKIFSNPDQIDLQRRPAHLSFGAGPYRCIGAGLAQLQAGVGLGKFISATKAYNIERNKIQWKSIPYMLRGPSAFPMTMAWNHDFQPA